MSNTAQIPVRPLYTGMPNVGPSQGNMPIESQACSSDYYSWGLYVVIFLIVAILTWIIIYAAAPEWFRIEVNGVKTDQLNSAKILLTSVIAGIIIVLLVWLFRTRF